MSKVRALKYSIIFIAAAILIYISVNAVEIWDYSKVDEKQTADVIVVLGAEASGGEVSPVFRERINHAIWLYKNGYADKLIFTGGYGDGEEYSEGYSAQEYAKSQGIPAEDILIEESSAITEENLKNAKQIMGANGFKTAILVSDPLHMKRAMLLARDTGITAYTSPTPTSMYKSLKTKLKFLGRELFYYIGYKMLRLI